MSDITYNRLSITAETPKYKIIYGESETHHITGEYQFVVYKNGQEKARYSNSELLLEAQGVRPIDLFLAGMVKHFLK